MSDQTEKSSPPAVPRWAPRLARLYSKDVRKLEALYAAALAPGTKTWAEAIETLYQQVLKAGPAKGAKLVGRAIDYLNNIDPEQRRHFPIATHCGSRNALLVFATFSIGNHPNPAVTEQGLAIEAHLLNCSRSHPSWATAIPVAFISNHAVTRLYERGYYITENSHATTVFAFIGIIGYLVHESKKHADGGMHLAVADLLVAGAIHQFTRTLPNRKSFEERFYDVRTVLPVDELGPHHQPQLEQGRIAASVAVDWLKGDGTGEDTLAERIPRVERRDDIYSLRQKEKIL